MVGDAKEFLFVFLFPVLMFIPWFSSTHQTFLTKFEILMISGLPKHKNIIIYNNIIISKKILRHTMNISGSIFLHVCTSAKNYFSRPTSWSFKVFVLFARRHCWHPFAAETGARCIPFSSLFSWFRAVPQSIDIILENMKIFSKLRDQLSPTKLRIH